MGGAYIAFIFLTLFSLLYQTKGNHVLYPAYNPYRTKPITNISSLFQGNWVYDDSFPLYYNTTICPFIEKQFDCQKNGRKDVDYLKYIWRPSSYNLTRFNGVDFLRRFRGKRIMFVGDSLSLNQWTSLACMIHAAVPHARYTNVRVKGLSTITFTDYDLSILLSRNAFLVDIITTTNGTRVLKLNETISGPLWKTADALIFDSWHWWWHSGRKQPWDLIDDGKSIVKDMDRLVVYEKALRTWARWVDHNVDPTKIKVFFQGVSPDHDDGSKWGASGETCIGQVLPLFESKYPGGPTPGERILERVLGSMLKPVNLLDISFLSQLRKDGHPSVYGFGGHRFSDCTHWCLPGVPDSWNELFYAALLTK